MLLHSHVGLVPLVVQVRVIRTQLDGCGVIGEGLLGPPHLTQSDPLEVIALWITGLNRDHAGCIHGHLVVIMLALASVGPLAQRAIVLPVQLQGPTQQGECFLDVGRGSCPQEMVRGGVADKLLGLLPMILPKLVIVTRLAGGTRVPFVVDIGQHGVSLPGDLVTPRRLSHESLQLGNGRGEVLLFQADLRVSQPRLATYICAAE